MLKPLLAVVAVCSTGCATIFTGTKQDIALTSTPPGATVVVVGGVGARLALKLKAASDLKDVVVNILGPAVSPQLRELLLAQSPDELLTSLVMLTKADELPPELVAGGGQLVEKLPDQVKERLLGALGIESFGVTPWKAQLQKGHSYVVVSWSKGTRARLLEVKTRFNWVVLLNVFNAFLGVIVDGLTGAWLNLEPSEVVYTLEPRPAVAPPP